MSKPPLKNKPMNKIQQLNIIEDFKRTIELMKLDYDTEQFLEEEHRYQYKNQY